MFGRYTFNYIKGAPTKNSTTVNAVLDTTALIAFFARFGLQMLRYVLVLVKLGLVSHFFGESIKKNTAYLSDSFELNQVQLSFSEFNLSSLKNAAIWALHHMFETLETMLIYYAQTGALCIVVVWLLSALYSYSKPLAKVLWYAWSRRNEK
jgi:uncharacterized membrane protein